MGVPKNLRVVPSPDPIGHFGTPWRPFWIFETVIEGMIESKNLFSESLSVGPITYGLFHFHTPSAMLDLGDGEVLQAVRHCRRCKAGIYLWSYILCMLIGHAGSLGISA